MDVPRPVLLVLAILAAVKVFVGAASVAELVGPPWIGVIIAGLAAVDIGVGFYLQNRVVPLQSTLAYVHADEIRAGGAATQLTGSAVGNAVTVGELNTQE
jgi:uncharacterized membrane protein